MRKLFLTLSVLVLSGSFAYAQTPATDAAKTKSLATLIERMSGKVDSVQKADSAKGDFGALSILGNDGKKKDFFLIAKTKVYALNSVPSSLDQIKKGDSILVLYVVTIKGLNEAISVSQIR